MKSTSGLSICPRNWRAYADSDSTYRRCPSAKIVSNARLDLPEPDRPVKTISASRGRSRLTSRRLCSRAPRTIRRSATCSQSSQGEAHQPAWPGYLRPPTVSPGHRTHRGVRAHNPLVTDNEPSPGGFSRRQILAGLGGAGAAAALAGSGRALAGAHRLVDRAASVRAAGADLGAVEHVVSLMMENRSYDHYFGTYEKGRGFDDHPAHRLRRFAQVYPDGQSLDPPGVLLPFRLHMPRDECTRDLKHDWGPMHECWNHGKMNHWVRVHTSDEVEGNPRGALTMGYYTRKELAFYYSLADHFTLGDAYFSSILGPTHPNRIMQMTGTIDPAGTMGGPVTDTTVGSAAKWSCSWPTVQEVLEDAGVGWKVYHPSSDDVASMG